MKLLTKTTLLYLLFSLPLLLASGWVLYHNIEHSLKNEIDEELVNSKMQWVAQADSITIAKDITELSDPFILIERTNLFRGTDMISDTLIYHTYEEEMVPYRILETFIKRNDQYYKLSFLRSMVEQEDVFKGLALLMCMVFGGLLLMFLLINLYINTSIWKPFNSSMQKIRSLNMDQLQHVHFDKVYIREFNDLNTSLNAMTAKMNSDYLSIKTFTQNASHEIQTPLAIIQSKLELLLQDSDLSEKQASVISSASDATQRLSKLNQALLLITKIENKQFTATEVISIADVTEKYLAFFAELLEQKKIICSLTVKEDWKLSIHTVLADMLVSNLLINAIRYNEQNGQIRITITANSWQISNSGDHPALDKTLLFRRFYKSSTATGNGLGLAIVKEICDSNGLSVDYDYEKGWHQFIIGQGA